MPVPRRELALLFLAACGGPADMQPPVTTRAPAPPVAPGPADTQPPVATRAPAGPAPLVARGPVGAGVLAVLDPTVDPCVDFYQYACGGWLKATVPPADRSRYSRGFDELADRNNAVVRQILERAAAATGEVSPIDRKLGAFWSACMDEAAIEQAGMAPIAPLLARVAAVRDEASVWRVVGELHSSFAPGYEPLFTRFVAPDAKHPDVYVAYVLQGGIGLPERDYYVHEEPRRRRLLAAYREHVARMLELLGEATGPAAEHAAAIVAFETELAEISLPLAERREQDKVYHPLGTEGLQRLDPKLPWTAYFDAIGQPRGGGPLVVMTPTYFEKLGEIVRATPTETLQAYLRWHIVHSAAPALGRAVVATDFALTTALTGVQELPPRWRRCVQLTNGLEAVDLSTTGMMLGLGEMVGQKFVKERFAGESEATARTMIGFVESAFVAGLPALAWMDPDTRARAVEKLKLLRNKIGRPEAWHDYSRLELSRTDHLANVLAWRRFQSARDNDRVGEPVDRVEWWMPPTIVSAYYDPFKNEMVFPAGVLQPPFFSAEFPMSMNFGAIGMVVGHELTHGFDDQGRKYDANGVLGDWWDPGAVDRFKARARCIEELYDGVEVPPGTPLDGALMLGENIADFGGIKAAYAGYQEWRAGHSDERPIEGLSDEQLFFLGYAQIWCAHETPESQRLNAAVDQHAPPNLRVNMPLQHFPRFAEAWRCAPGAPMRAAQVCEVW